MTASTASQVDVPLDAAAHRSNRNYPRSTNIRRVVWACVAPLFRFTPRLCYAWRNGLLRLFGAKIGRGVRIYPSVKVTFPWNLEVGDFATIGRDVELYCLGKVVIGKGSLVSQRVHVCAGTHDYTQPNLPLLTPPIRIGQGVWCCADAFLGPGITVGDGAIVGARAVVVRSVDANVIVGGNPARAIGHR
ncbi:MAG: putative colanic acid biosynthesis acetyltransferase [Planctomycetota bacterium]|nr:MAG: putative colanic acid biosynthesis acetyltransferase [Planctomycetota bacterium]REK46556.1 MAG: putative colanic acid biosynthesis acetyltransferase [Planctomycetota bacterium]